MSLKMIFYLIGLLCHLLFMKQTDEFMEYNQTHNMMNISLEFYLILLINLQIDINLSFLAFGLQNLS